MFFNELLTLNRLFYLLWRDLAFLCESMAKDRNIFSMEEIQDSVVDMFMPNTKFINVFIEFTAMWPSQFGTERLQQLNKGKALSIRFD